MDVEGVEEHVRAETCEDSDLDTSSLDLISGLTGTTYLCHDSFSMYTSHKMAASMDGLYSYKSMDGVLPLKSRQGYMRPEFVARGPPNEDYVTEEFGKDSITGGRDIVKKDKNWIENDTVVRRYLKSLDRCVSKECKSIKKSLKEAANSQSLQNNVSKAHKKSRKKQEQDQQKKFERLGSKDSDNKEKNDSEKQVESDDQKDVGVTEKNDFEKQVESDYQKGVGETEADRKISLHGMSQFKGDNCYNNDKQLQHVAENGVKYYTDNRLVEEQRERDETVSKQRLDPQMSGEEESWGPKSTLFLVVPEKTSKIAKDIETSEREATEDSWRDIEYALDSDACDSVTKSLAFMETRLVGMETNFVSLGSQLSYNGSVLMPEKTKTGGQESSYQSKEVLKLFVRKDCLSESITPETVRNKIDMCFTSHPEKTEDNKRMDDNIENDAVIHDDDEDEEEQEDAADGEEKHMWEEKEKDNPEKHVMEEKEKEDPGVTENDEMMEKEEAMILEEREEEDPDTAESLGVLTDLNETGRCSDEHEEPEPKDCGAGLNIDMLPLRKDMENRRIAWEQKVKVLSLKLQIQLAELQGYWTELKKEQLIDNAVQVFVPDLTPMYTARAADPPSLNPVYHKERMPVCYCRSELPVNPNCRSKESRKSEKSREYRPGDRCRKFWVCYRWKPKANMEKSDGFYIPKGKDTGRKWHGSKGHNYGRTCSNSGGKGGNYSGGSNDSDSNQRQSGGDDEGDHFRAPKGPDRNGSDGDEGQDDDDDTNNHGNSVPNSAELPPADYKRFRKKHSSIDIMKWTDFLGEFAYKTKDGVLVHVDTTGVSVCVELCLSSPDDLSDEMMDCYVCIVISQFLKHYADCSSQFNACSICVQVFSLICSHVSDCSNNNTVCDISLCTNIVRIINGGDLSNHLKSLWFHVRKKLNRIIGSSDDIDLAGSDNGDSLTSCTMRSGRHSSITRPSSLSSIPEDPESHVPKPASGSRVLSRKRSNLANVEESTEPHSPQEYDEEGSSGVGDAKASKKESSSVIYTRGETVDIVTTRNRDDDERRTNFMDRVQSMPQGRTPNFMAENYFPSMELGATGIKGIREVVYGDRFMLLIAAKYWLGLKNKYKEEGSLARHYREEGVILKEYQASLVIEGFRYNCNFQWVKHNHLGNGMSGKCHLASDFNSNFKFCVKEIHISNYEIEEIELWSELDHPNIVKIYGAIRHQETIYIIQEFIEGGNLTEAINTQKILGRRLSQVTALTYFRQLLEVLVYLRGKHILHEDIKADNILLKQEEGRVYIKVTDFGLARRCTHSKINTNPAGTQTQWSPEKAEGQGYGYPAEIVQKSPPLEDIPRNIEDDVRDMIERGFTVCSSTRPDADKLLKHRAFRLLNERGNGNHTSILYSVLPSDGHITDSTVDVNADLKEIYENLVNNNNNNSKAPYIADQNREYPVYIVHGVQGDNSSLNQTGSQSQREVTSAQGDHHTASPGIMNASHLIGMIDTEYGVGGAMAEGGAPAIAGIDRSLLDMYLSDTATAAPPTSRPQPMVYYNPAESHTEPVEETGTTQTDEMMLQAILPDFKKLGLSDDEDDESYETEDMFKDFDLAKEIPKVVQSFSQTSLTLPPESPHQSGSDNPVVRDTTALDSSVVLDEQYNTIENEDELFISGPTQHSTISSQDSSQSSSTGAQHTLDAAVARPTSIKTSTGAREKNPNTTTPTTKPASMSLQPTLSQSQNSSSRATQFHDYSLAPYLVPRDIPRPAQTQSPDSSGPHKPKRGRYDIHQSQSGSGDYSPGQNQPMPKANLPYGNKPHVNNPPPSNVPNTQKSKTNATANSSTRQIIYQDQLPYILDFSQNQGTKPPQLHIDVDKAQKGPVLPSTCAQTAPVISPPSYQRMTSERAPSSHQQQQQQPQPHKTPSSTSTSQYDQQEAAYRELNDALSQHSDHALWMMNDEQDDPENDVPAELDFDIENPASSIAHYLGDSPSDAIKVTFLNKTLDKKLTVKFPIKNKTSKWAHIFEEELSRHSELFEDLDRIILRYENGTTVDLDDCLGDSHVTLLVEEATEEDPWCMQKGMIMSSKVCFAK